MDGLLPSDDILYAIFTEVHYPPSLFKRGGDALAFWEKNKDIEYFSKQLVV